MDRADIDASISYFIGKIMAGTIASAERARYEALLEKRREMMTSPVWARLARARLQRSLM